MFGLSTSGSYRAPVSGSSLVSGRSAAFRSAFAYFVKASGRLVASGRLDADSTASTAAQLWCFVYGFITLEMAGHFDSFNSPVNEVRLPLSRNVIVGMGDSAQRATASGLRAFKTCGKLSE